MLEFLRRLVFGVLLLVGAGVILAAYWLGLVPSWLSPIRPIDLAQPPGWFVDAQLAMLRRNPGLCQSLLKSPQIVASPVPDNPPKNQCGWRNAVKMSSASEAAATFNPLTCEAAAGVAMWVAYDVQPLAQEILGAKVASVEDFGTYDCRRMIGNPLWKGYMSEHASANALDVSGFTLADGRKISVLKHWRATGPEARFLREVHRRACRYFRVSLSPEFNAAHRDHFHFDRGLLWTCR